MVRLFDDFYRFVRIDPVDARRDDRVAGQQSALDGDHVAADRLAEFDPVQPGAAFAVYRPDVVAVVAFEYGGQRYGRQAGAVGVVEIANSNCPAQLVIAGDAAAVEKAGELALQAGAKRVVPLKVSGPFHTSLMAPAGEALAEKFRSVAFGEMSFPVLFNCKGGPMEAGETIPELLVRQVQSSVYLEDTIRAMAGMGVDTIVEIGPGKALSAFVKKTEKGIKTYAVETVEDIEKLCEALKGEQA